MWWLPTPPTWSSSCWISRGGGYDLLIDCVGVPSAFNTGLRALKPEFYMRATAVGLPHAQFPLDYERLVLKRVLLRGSKGHNFDEFKTVINAMALAGSP